jgi:hypothetical protein
MSVAWKPLVIAPQAEIARRISTVLAELTPDAAVVRTEYARIGTGAQIALETAANICFLDVASNSAHAQVLIAEISPLAPVVALHHCNDADLILRCLRRGACEYLADPSAAQCVRFSTGWRGRAWAPAKLRARSNAWRLASQAAERARYAARGAAPYRHIQGLARGL